MKWKSVLVTGADGFIGSYLTEELVRNGVRVRALSYYNSFNYWGWLEDVECLDRIEVVSGDVRDPSFCLEITKDVEVIFNLAALIGIPYSYIAPNSYIDTNVKGALHIYEAARRHGTQRVIQISSSEVYGTARYVPIDEEHPLQPQSPYSATKIAADALATSYHHSFGLPVIIARPFNTYGPRQSARAIIPTIIAQLASGQKRVKLGNVTPTRDLTYVTDTCRALIALSQCEEAVGEVVNIGSNYEISVRDLFEMINGITESSAVIDVDKERVRPLDSEVERLWCNNEKLISMTKFKLEYGLEEGLTKTIKWFQNPMNLNKYKAGLYNV
ncbi:MAG: GDP-mannose 4,6-dehydratase [Syntrophales bacterium]|jgi:NAD dependent epimerase/dehydratase